VPWTDSRIGRLATGIPAGSRFLDPVPQKVGRSLHPDRGIWDAATLKGSVISLVAWNYRVLLSKFWLRLWPVCSIDACCWRG